jgi:hypothetical protein
MAHVRYCRASSTAGVDTSGSAPGGVRFDAMSVYGSRRDDDGWGENSSDPYRSSGSPEASGHYSAGGYDTPGPYQGPSYGHPTDPPGPYGPLPPRPVEAPPRRRPLLNRTTIIIAVLVALVVGAGTAGAATLLTAGDDKPNSTGTAANPATGGRNDAQPATSAPAATEPISMSATGDVVMGMAPGGLPPNNGKGFFNEVAPLLKADFQMMNLEQTITDDTGVGKCSAESAGKTCFAFRTPPATVQNLKDAGTHLVNLANNHAWDFGEAGYKNTQDALDSVQIKYTGFPGQITVVQVKGTKIAVVGFASYKEWSNLCSDLDASTAIIKKADEQADLVVVQVHMGAEGADKTRVKAGTETFLGENRCDPIKFSHTVVDAGADLVVGHGPHVVRGMEFYQGRLIAYSLGNFAGYRALGYNGVVGITAVIRINLKPDGTWAGGTLIPTHMIAPGLPRPDPNKRAISMISDLTKRDFPQTGPAIAADGTITAPA